MRFASWEADGRVAAGVVSDAGLHEHPARTTVLDLVRAAVEIDGPECARAVVLSFEDHRAPVRCDGGMRDGARHQTPQT